MPPGDIAAVLIATGGLVLWTLGFEIGSFGFIIGIGFLLVGVAIVAWAVVITENLREAVPLLTTMPEEAQLKGDNDESETTPPSPQSIKNDLFFDRANQECEWCGDPSINPKFTISFPEAKVAQTSGGISSCFVRITIARRMLVEFQSRSLGKRCVVKRTQPDESISVIMCDSNLVWNSVDKHQQRA